MWVDDIIQALRNLNGMARNAQIFEEIRRTKIGLSGNWKATVRRTIQQNSSDTDSWLERNDFFYAVEGVGNGFWGLRDFFPINTDDIQIVADTPPPRVEMRIQRIIRNSAMISQLKVFHSHTCQICYNRIQIGQNLYYSEGHHIQPLGVPHNGPDVASNVIIVCPNCHILCDYGVIPLDINRLNGTNREIGDSYVQYHNRLIHKSV